MKNSNQKGRKSTVGASKTIGKEKHSLLRVKQSPNSKAASRTYLTMARRKKQSLEQRECRDRLDIFGRIAVVESIYEDVVKRYGIESNSASDVFEYCATKMNEIVNDMLSAHDLQEVLQDLGNINIAIQSQKDIIANLDKSTVFKTENSDERIIHNLYNPEFSPNDLQLKQIDLDYYHLTKMYWIKSQLLEIQNDFTGSIDNLSEILKIVDQKYGKTNNLFTETSKK